MNLQFLLPLEALAKLFEAKAFLSKLRISTIFVFFIRRAFMFAVGKSAKRTRKGFAIFALKIYVKLGRKFCLRDCRWWSKRGQRAFRMFINWCSPNFCFLIKTSPARLHLHNHCWNEVEVIITLHNYTAQLFRGCCCKLRKFHFNLTFPSASFALLVKLSRQWVEPSFN